MKTLFCKLCGTEFEKTSNNQKFCKNCGKLKRNMKEMLRFRRKRSLGTTDFFGHAKKDFDEEYRLIQQEKKRLGLKRNL